MTDASKSNPIPHQLFEFLKAVEILAIQLVNSEFYVRMPAEVLSHGRVSVAMKYEIATTLRPATDKLPRELFCFVTANISGVLKEDDPDYKNLEGGEALSGHCQFVVRYRVKGEEEFPTEVVDTFAKGQATFQAHPYIRTYVDQQFSFMGIQGIVLPLMKVSPPPQK